MAVVLIVDDEFGIMKLLEDVLTDEGHRVLTASNGRQALERAAEEKPSLGGHRLHDARYGRRGPGQGDGRRCTQLADIPVVIMSSMPEATVAERSPAMSPSCASLSIFSPSSTS